MKSITGSAFQGITHRRVNIIIPRVSIIILCNAGLNACKPTKNGMFYDPLLCTGGSCLSVCLGQIALSY